MKIIQQGSKEPEVMAAQRFYNYLAPRQQNWPIIDEDQNFGSHTLEAVRRVQALRGITPQTGVVDVPTWRALGQRQEIEQQVTAVPQHQPHTCWKAATAMALRKPINSISPDGAMINERDPFHRGALLDGRENVGAFARAIGYRCVDPVETPKQLAVLLRSSPIIVFSNISYPNPSQHVVVISALWSDESYSDDVSTVRISDPLNNSGHAFASPF
jgi:Putative peptidoglycan binding domain